MSLSDVGSKVWQVAASIAAVQPAILLILFVFLLAVSAEAVCRVLDRLEEKRHKNKAASAAAH